MPKAAYSTNLHIHYMFQMQIDSEDEKSSHVAHWQAKSRSNEKKN
jgi:hypothetical protein